MECSCATRELKGICNGGIVRPHYVSGWETRPARQEPHRKRLNQSHFPLLYHRRRVRSEAVLKNIEAGVVAAVTEGLGTNGFQVGCYELGLALLTPVNASVDTSVS
jgi:hypothetical protein